MWQEDGGWRGQTPGTEFCWGYFPAPKQPSGRWLLQKEVSPTPGSFQGTRSWLGGPGHYQQTPTQSS